MKIRIGILSPFYKAYNYGEKLQAYALTEYLRRQGVEAEQIQYAQPASISPFDDGRIPRRLWNSPVLRRRLFQRMLGRCMPWLGEKVSRRQAALNSFDTQVPHSEKVYVDGELEQTVGEYDGFVVGSGQVWNPAAWKPGYYLDFLYGRKYSFSYAASVANGLSQCWEIYYETHLSQFDGISVREITAQHLVEQATHWPAEVSVDPVLLLNRSDWAVMSEPICTPERYMLCFFEGPGRHGRKVARMYSKRWSLPIVTLPHLAAAEDGRYYASDLGFGDTRLYDVTPGQLIMLIQRAECVMTDGYHVTALSLLFKKPLMVFDREWNEHMITRLQELMRLFCMEERYCDKTPAVDAMYRMEQRLAGYSQPFTDFEQLRAASIAYLDKQLAAVRASAGDSAE